MSTASVAPYRTERYGGVGIRFLALLVDTIILTAVTWPFADVTREPGFFRARLEGWPAAVVIVIWLAYFTIMEATVGATVGKLVFGLRVRAAGDETRIGFGPALVRNLLRIVDALPVLYLVGAIAAWTSPRRQRVGDRVGKTVVLHTRAIGEAPAGPPPPMPTFAHEGPLAPPPPPEPPPPPPSVS